MVKNYLEKIREQLLEKKIETSNDIKELSNRYKENVEFMKLLEESNDPTFESFTPREVNSFNRTKILELEQLQKILIEELTETREKLQKIDTDIYEINSVIKVADFNNKIATGNDNSKLILETLEKEKQRIAKEMDESTLRNLTLLLSKVEICSKIIETDSSQCKKELISIGKILKSTIEETQKIIYDL